ncbi:hypothetical protein Rsub_04259 [Raphidocelis subcapitata]|uniref:Uncharacterized protein n=1 Tax=Raphidocelis subcapitata TaxID=307507 RepID=A0A2V0NW16_9CHLO|nr:hypothetical protein Rsub_04259 [Raphidocelis subcapitata]|eukprot:GBF91519.1 hypothetical protein Rsub_04259 [Raphidocelis subcapitata]
MLVGARSTQWAHASGRRPFSSGAVAARRAAAPRSTPRAAAATRDAGDAADATRRGALLAAVACVAAAAAAGPAAAAPPRPGLNKEVDAGESPYIQELLRRTEEKRDERAVERRRAYDRKIFREYLSFDAGSPETARARGIKPDTAAAIRKWLDDNDPEKMPGLRKRQE